MNSAVIHHYQDLIEIFNTCFSSDYNTRLVKGDAEPVYLPAHEDQTYHAIFFAHGFFSSALHECAHWLIAGKMRRQLIDYGYWYAPDGRNKEQQILFQQVEVKPQALEWILTVATGSRFQLSIDNLNGEEFATEAFKEDVYQQVLRYIEEGLSKRAAFFREALCSFYGTSLNFETKQFIL